MDSEFVLFPPQASTLATKIDAVFFYILTVAVFFTVLIAVLLLYFAIKYRRRSNNEVPRPIDVRVGGERVLRNRDAAAGHDGNLRCRQAMDVGASARRRPTRDQRAAHP